jgi:hypothetical protein
MSKTTRCRFLALWACISVPMVSGAQTISTTGGVAVLSVDGRTNANPTVAVAGNVVAVAWSAATTSSMDIFAAVSTDGGTTFGAPVQVNSVVGEARVSGEEPPRIALVPRKGGTPEIVVVWTAKAGPNWKLLQARSTDGGRRFSPSSPVPGSVGDGTRGWQSIAVDARGRVSVLWLDHRGTVAADSAHKHAMAMAGPNSAPMPKADPTERAGLSELYFATLDGTEARALAKSVCYCCKTSLAVSGDNVYAVWRHVFSGGYRDMAFTISRDRGKTFAPLKRVNEDLWKFDGCPDNGPSIAIDPSQRAHVVWPTPADGKTMSDMALFYAVSRDGSTFGPRTRIPSKGPASHPQIVPGNDGSMVVAWDEIVDGARRLGMSRARVAPSGAVTFQAMLLPESTPGAWYPALAASPLGVVAVWVRPMGKSSTIGVATMR